LLLACFGCLLLLFDLLDECFQLGGLQELFVVVVVSF